MRSRVLGHSLQESSTVIDRQDRKWPPPWILSPTSPNMNLQTKKRIMPEIGGCCYYTIGSILYVKG